LKSSQELKPKHRPTPVAISKTGHGVITGTFANPSNPKQPITVNGVLLQNKTNAQGFFLGTCQSGTFLLAPH
jgi:hypothetical protein